jgi:hypothetical protein
MYKIVIPYRDREEHLKLFAKYAIPFFEETGRKYKIIIVEQDQGKPFNLGKLTNVGFDLYKKIDDGYESGDSFILHPVDCIPYDAHYDAPRGGIAKLASHYSTPRDPDDELTTEFTKRSIWYPRKSQVPQGEPRDHGVPSFYKALSIDPIAYERVNGFTNECWGWGGEDNEFFVRLSILKIKTVHRLCLYDMLDHDLASLEHHGVNLLQSHILERSGNLMRSGLNNVSYKVVEKTEKYGFETYICEI